MNSTHSKQKQQAQRDIDLLKGVCAFGAGVALMLLWALFGQ